jgi:hypothetical protein
MERPTLDHYREVLHEQGIELPDDELRACATTCAASPV